MAKEFNKAANRGEEMGLSDNEISFCDALETNEVSVRKLSDETLKKIAVELTENLRKTRRLIELSAKTRGRDRACWLKEFCVNINIRPTGSRKRLILCLSKL